MSGDNGGCIDCSRITVRTHTLAFTKVILLDLFQVVILKILFLVYLVTPMVIDITVSVV